MVVDKCACQQSGDSGSWCHHSIHILMRLRRGPQLRSKLKKAQSRPLLITSSQWMLCDILFLLLCLLWLVGILLFCCGSRWLASCRCVFFSSLETFDQYGVVYCFLASASLSNYFQSALATRTNQNLTLQNSGNHIIKFSILKYGFNGHYQAAHFGPLQQLWK